MSEGMHNYSYHSAQNMNREEMPVTHVVPFDAIKDIHYTHIIYNGQRFYEFEFYFYTVVIEWELFYTTVMKSCLCTQLSFGIAPFCMCMKI